ncbi:unnamed protein product, partial [Closterium sp. NIES-53]
SQPQLLPGSPLPAPSPYPAQTGSLAERREPESRHASHVRNFIRARRSRPPTVPGTHTIALRPSTVPQRIALPSPPASSLPDVPDPQSDLAHAASPTSASALVTELVDLAATRELALGCDVFEDKQFELECLAAILPHFASMLLYPEGDPDALDILTPRSYAEAITGPYDDEVPPHGANIVDGMRIFRVNRPPGGRLLRLTLAALGFTPSSADLSLFMRTDPTLPPFYILVYCTPLPIGNSLSAPPSDESVEASGPYPELVGCLMYLMTCTRPDLAYPLSILARFVAHGQHRKEHWMVAQRVLCYSCSTSGVGLVLGGHGSVVLTGHSDASWADDQATQRSSQGYSFSLGSIFVLWRSTRSSSVLGSSCEAEIYAGAMAAQELRWLAYLLTDLGERLRSPPVLYIDNKAMISLCQEQRLEHRTKHIALRYFLAWELQQRGELRLAYVTSWANTADVFTKALVLGDHQRFCTAPGLVPTPPHLLVT